jgi:hypothetical protein
MIVDCRYYHENTIGVQSEYLLACLPIEDSPNILIITDLGDFNTLFGKII